MTGVLGVTAGCEQRLDPEPGTVIAATAQEFVDTDFGFRAVPPASWRNVGAETFRVPGKVIQGWMAEDQSNIVAFLQEGGGGQAVTANMLLQSSSAAVRQMGGTVISEEVIKIGAAEVMSLKLTAPGTGSALAPGGPLTTYEHWIAVPKKNRVLVLLATAPDSNKTETVNEFEAMIGSLKLD